VLFFLRNFYFTILGQFMIVFIKFNFVIPVTKAGLFFNVPSVGRFWLQIQSYELETQNIENGIAR